MTLLRSRVTVNFMKKISLYIFLILIWCNVSNAGSIKDYEKGGMKLGKSLLELMTYDEIVEGLRPIQRGEDFVATLYIPNPFIDICQEKKISRTIELGADVAPGTETKKGKTLATQTFRKTPQNRSVKQESQVNTLDAK